MRVQLTIKKLRIILSIVLAIESRTLFPKIVKLSSLMLKPVPVFLKSAHSLIPASTGIISTHALSGATTSVMADKNEISLKIGESLDYQFFASPYSAQSFKVQGLPTGLSSSFSYPYGKIHGTLQTQGNFPIKITGYRYSSYRGNATPTYTLNLIVTGNTDSDKNETEVVSNFSDLDILDNGWYHSWLGIFNIPNNGNWIFHSHLGWLYAHPSAQDTFWLYDKDLGWLYTSKTLDRYFYSNSTGGWLYKLDSTSDNRFWDYQENSEVQ